MKIKLLTVGEISDPCCRQLADKYGQRIDHYFPFERTAVRAEKLASLPPQEALLREARRIANQMQEADHSVVLDRRGKMLDSPGLAEWLNRSALRSIKTLLVIIGGPYGVHENLQQAADERLSLSSMTMGHELAAVLFLEQLYRACTILRGEKYHK
ncbi:MAG TPA: 23S rRNA (pseudouridine(1915)-N(3))-methyltransferase RlmH [bacterium]|jgi:23S rRNA (pseudouridine1915-N3)-methyltransferase|nr:23S rRNA (pseudouridine(1915)-N(3))-methyltransferase RlmH [bacterium]HNT66181.1 23S rRNA (pseudouridine(1915)-N(3))-methyltransferase RlmH [bacterium]HOX86254.1 23S rRNA (pseudouridine(1915)-N(3))-methyltransferase RlmH [bacterium]HPG45532.1 23S rRNA (pseudouridine(1915)-N(3))-methyltransferase RlmH [bacterium]HPM97689.1 23S rRNA (pseudouridine(1915)-N(3))-methyltransferase RlmH [bacterium]